MTWFIYILAGLGAGIVLLILGLFTLAVKLFA